MCHLRVIGRLKHAEAADVRLVFGVITRVVAHEYPARGRAVAVGDEFLRGPMQVKWMLSGIEELLLVNQQRWNPLRVVGINRPGHLQEVVQIAAVCDLTDFQPPAN